MQDMCNIWYSSLKIAQLMHISAVYFLAIGDAAVK